MRAALALDAALGDELDLILPALSASGRRAFLRAFARRCATGGRPAAAVLEALVATASGTALSGRGARLGDPGFTGQGAATGRTDPDRGAPADDQEPSRRRSVAILPLVLCMIALLIACVAPSSAARRPVRRRPVRPLNREFADARFDQVNGGDYGFLYRCEEDEDANALQIRPITGSPKGGTGGSPGRRRPGRGSWPPTSRRGRNDAGHEARLSFLGDRDEEVGRIATGSDGATGFERYVRELGDGGRAGFAATLACTAGSGCAASDRAKAWLRSVRLTIDDRRAPAPVVGGSSALQAGSGAPARSVPSPRTRARGCGASRSPSTVVRCHPREPSPVK